jgi:putative proteasome-type protease
VEEGLVGIADTRVSSGRELLTARKVASYSGPGFSFFIMNSGLRSLRDKALLYFEEAFAKQTGSRERLYKAVDLYAAQVRRLYSEEGKVLLESDLRFNVHALIGGQMVADTSHRLFMVYPEGNWVEVGPDTPYQIIGNGGYGKPILERSLKQADSLLYAFKVGVLAFDATRLCASDVDFPIDVLLYRRGTGELIEHRYEREELAQISGWWQSRMRAAVDELPADCVEPAFARLKDTAVPESVGLDPPSPPVRF